LRAANDLNLRISGSDWDTVLENADMREQLRQIAEIAQDTKA